MGGTALGASGRSNNGLKLDVKTGKLSLWRLFPTFTFTFGPSAEVPEPARSEPRRLTEPFLEAGAALVALRRGERGAVVHERASGQAFVVPAFPRTAVVDPTGCGNAFCGALLAARVAGEGLAAAAAWGCSAGSLMAEHRGTPAATPRQLAAEARRRQAELLGMAAPL